MSAVPCNGCTACCHHDLIFMHPEYGDDVSCYDVEWQRNLLTGETGLALKHKPGGGCIYVTETGCSIHDHVPSVCRDFDCRKMYQSLMALPRPDRRRLLKTARKRNLMSLAVIEAARSRLHTLEASDA